MDGMALMDNFQLYYRNMSKQDVKNITDTIIYLKPYLKDYMFIGIEKHKSQDKNLVIHMQSPVDENGNYDERIELISAEYIISM